MMPATRRTAASAALLACTLLAARAAEAGGPFPGLERRAGYSAMRPVYAPTPTQALSAVGAGLAPSPMLGSMYPTPYMTVGGNGVSGGAGYTPMQNYGDRSMTMYGPFAALRPITAPVNVNVRGYDGIVRPTRGNTSSYPFLPPAGAAVYPTRTNERGSFGYQRTPPWWDGGHNWVDFR